MYITSSITCVATAHVKILASDWDTGFVELKIVEIKFFIATNCPQDLANVLALETKEFVHSRREVKGLIHSFLQALVEFAALLLMV